MLLAAMGYFSFLPVAHGSSPIGFSGVVITWIFSILAFVGQLSLFSYLACLVAILIILLIPKKWLALMLAVVLGSSMVLFIVVDMFVYHLYRFHFGNIFWHILNSGALSEVLVFSSNEWLLAGCLLLLVVGIEIGLAVWLWRRVLRVNKKRHGLPVVVSLLGSLFISYAIYAHSLLLGARASTSVVLRANAHLIVMAAKIVPYYNTTLGYFLSKEGGAAQLNRADDGYFMQNDGVSRRLNYPQKALQIRPKKKPYNILMISIDTWRYDAMNAKVTPNIAQFAQQSLQFEQHISGGNCTQPGIFSMFYGLPANYWSAMQAQNVGPLFIHTLLQQHYQLGIYASASLNYPAFDSTVFREVPNLQIETQGATSAARDKKITRQFKQFLAGRNKRKPFFGFLFYDEVHNWCGSDQPYALPFQPAIKTCNHMVLGQDTSPVPYLNRYDNAAHYVDGLVGQVLASLKRQHLLNHTIVMITADHGEEFNDENLGYWGHASAYDRYQIHVPMIVHWPGMPARKITYPTSHFDLVPTLMQRVLGVKNTFSDYSTGQSLFAAGKRPFYIVGSYVDYAVLQPKRINVFYTGGGVDVQNRDGQALAGASVSPGILSASFKQLGQFFYQRRL